MSLPKIGENATVIRIIHVLPYVLSAVLSLYCEFVLTRLIKSPVSVIPAIQALSPMIDLALGPNSLFLASIAVTIHAYLKLRTSRVLILITALYVYSLIYSLPEPSVIALYILTVLGVTMSYGWGRALKMRVVEISERSLLLPVAAFFEYLLPFILISLYSSWLVLLIKLSTKTLPKKLPEPLASVVAELIGTRFGILAISVAGLVATIWIIKEVLGLGVLALTITREVAREEAATFLETERKVIKRREYPRLASISISFLATIPALYSIVYAPEITTAMPNEFRLAITMILYPVIGYLVERGFRSIILGEISFKRLAVGSFGLLTVLLAYLHVSHGLRADDMLRILVGSPAGPDPLAPFADRFKNQLLELNEIAKLVNDWFRVLVKLIWA